MSADLNGKSKVQERLDDIYSQMIHEEFVRNTGNMSGGGNSCSSKDYDNLWFNIENRKRQKIRYYYSNYSLKKLFIDFFLIIITFGLAIIFFIYRHKKHIEYKEKIKNGEWKEEDFKTDVNYLSDKEKEAKFLNIDI